jgi:hypothetical protein
MADLQATITEAVTLNGKVKGGTNSIFITGINDVYERNITVPTSEVTVYTTHASTVSGAQFDYDLVKYVRITNLDSANFIILRVANADNDEFMLKITAGNSFILGHHASNAMNADSRAITTTVDQEITSVKAVADTAACNVEVFVASA